MAAAAGSYVRAAASVFFPAAPAAAAVSTRSFLRLGDATGAVYTDAPFNVNAGNVGGDGDDDDTVVDPDINAGIRKFCK